MVLHHKGLSMTLCTCGQGAKHDMHLLLQPLFSLCTQALKHRNQ